MGTLYYGDSGTPIGIEDRALAHLKVAIVTKLRRGESFTLSWQHSHDQTPGRSTVWLHPTIPLRFVFDAPETPELSRERVEELMRSANTTGGIQLVKAHIDPEHTDTEHIDPEHIDTEHTDTETRTAPTGDTEPDPVAPAPAV
jgi:hypothetical protein